MEDLKGSTFLFIGRSGCGKGTQATQFEEFLKNQGYDVVKVTTGDLGRELARENSLVGRLVKRLLDEGKLFPSWMAIFINMEAIVKVLTSVDRILLIDGAPRRVFEAQAFDELMRDIGRSLPVPIHIDITEDEARVRLERRGRDDDKDKNDVAMRLSWFMTDVMPVLDYYGKRLVHIDGMGTIEETQKKLQSQIKEVKLENSGFKIN